MLVMERGLVLLVVIACFLVNVCGQSDATTPAPGGEETYTERPTTQFIPAPESTSEFQKLILTSCFGYCNMSANVYDTLEGCECAVECSGSSYGKFLRNSVSENEVWHMSMKHGLTLHEKPQYAS